MSDARETTRSAAPWAISSSACHWVWTWRMHYVVRTWGISKDFVPVTEKMFEGNLLPMSWVHAFLTVLLYFEGLLGILLILGLLSRWALFGGGIAGYRAALRHGAAIGLDRRLAPDDLSALRFYSAGRGTVRLFFGGWVCSRGVGLRRTGFSLSGLDVRRRKSKSDRLKPVLLKSANPSPAPRAASTGPRFSRQGRRPDAQ